MAETKLKTQAIDATTLRNGWVDAGEAWSYASATSITVPSGAASKYAKGDRIKLTQTTVKYFVVVGVADTTLTITGGTSYTFANAAVSENYYSHEASPVGYPEYFSYTVTATVPGGKAPTYADQSSAFSITGNTCHFKVYLSNTSGGTAGSTSNLLMYSLPVAPAGSVSLLGMGVLYEQDIATIRGLWCRNGGSSTFYLHTYDGNNQVGTDQSSVNRYLHANLVYAI